MALTKNGVIILTAEDLGKRVLQTMKVSMLREIFSKLPKEAFSGNPGSAIDRSVGGGIRSGRNVLKVIAIGANGPSATHSSTVLMPMADRV